jgi:hypothetical protein
MILLVCGGRDFGLKEDECRFVHDGIYNTLIENQRTDSSLRYWEHTIRSGAAPGVDTVALKFAKVYCITPDPMPVTQEEYDKYGKASPIKRNARMATKIPIPDLCLAFNGGRGTQDMINKANKLKIPVKRLIMGGVTEFME